MVVPAALRARAGSRIPTRKTVRACRPSAPPERTPATGSASGRSLTIVGLLVALVGATLISLTLRDWWILLPGTVVVVALALFAALAVEPLIAAAARRGVPRGVSVAALALLVLGIIGLVVVAVIPAAQSQFAAFSAGLPDILDQILQQPWALWLQSLLGSSVDLQAFGQGIIAYIQTPEQLVALWGGFLTVSNGVIAVLTGTVFVIVLWVYFALELPAIRAALVRTVRSSRRERTMAIVDEIADGVGRFVAGQVLLAVANGVVAFVTLTAVGGPAPILFAVVACLAAFIPVVGTFIGYGIAAAFCFTVSPVAGSVAGAVLLVYMLVEAYVLVPLVMRRAVRIPSSLVIVGAIVGASIGGIAGAFFAVPVIGALIVVHRRVVVPAQAAR